MASYVALLRAVNVGGTGKLPMSELKRLCEEAGFESVRTYIASGNVVFSSGDSPEKARSILEKRLEDWAGSRVDVLVRTAREMADLVEANPYPDQPGNQVAVLFLEREPPGDLAARASGSHERALQPRRQGGLRPLPGWPRPVEAQVRPRGGHNEEHEHGQRSWPRWPPKS